MSHYYPPSGPPPQQQQFGYPQQPPQGGQGWGQPQFGGPPGPYQQPPQQQQWMQPQGQQFQHMPPQQGYHQQGPPMQPGFQQPHQPPMQGYQQSPPQGYQQHLPPQGQPPFPQQQSGPAAPPSPGYANDVASGNANADVEALSRALSGFRRDHSTIIRILTKADPRQMALLRQTYAQRNKGGNLEGRLEDKLETLKANYTTLMVQLARGPLLADVYNVRNAIKGAGTREDMLNDVLIGRSNADMRAIKSAYQQTFGKTMESDVEGDLSLKTKAMFQLIMRASRTEDSYPYNPAEIGRDAETLHYAMRGPSVSTNQEAVYTILTQRSDNQIRAISNDYKQKYHKSLEDALESNFSGHMKDALLLCYGRAVDRAKTDAYALEATMKGMGTKDNLLINRTVRIHWDRQHADQVKKAYKYFIKRDLVDRVRGETSGDYRDALVSCYT